MEQSTPYSAGIEKKFAEWLEKPPLLPDPVFPPVNYLQNFGQLMFKSLLLNLWKRPDLVQQVRLNGADNVKAMLTAGWIGFWAFDFEEKTAQGLGGKDMFLDCVKEPIRRPPAHMAAFTAEHHIVAKGVHQIQIATGDSLPGQYEICKLKTIGWYAAQIVPPKANTPSPARPPV